MVAAIVLEARIGLSTKKKVEQGPNLVGHEIVCVEGNQKKTSGFGIMKTVTLGIPDSRLGIRMGIPY